MNRPAETTEGRAGLPARHGDRVKPEPAYTVIGLYCDNGQRYATTVYTHNGPEAAETLAQDACREDNDAETGDDLIEIAAVVTGEAEVVT